MNAQLYTLRDCHWRPGEISADHSYLYAFDLLRKNGQDLRVCR